MRTTKPTGITRTLWLGFSFWLVVVVAALYAVPQTASVPSKSGLQSPQPPGTAQQIIVKTDLVTVTVTVKDKQGNNIAALEKKDFRILDNRVPQEISFFSDADAPISIGNSL